jgi:serine/threonine-protein kinase
MGRGGFADGYLAWDEAFSKEHKVALKLYQYAEQPKYVQRYINREAILAQKLLSHPVAGFVKTYEVKWLPNELGLYIAQEYIPGRNLHDRIEARMFLEHRESLSLTIKLCDILAELHKQKIVHCDVKPLNVLIGSSGKPVLIDLGAARYFGEAIPKDEVVISVPYSSWSLLSGEPVDAKVDIYSLAMTLLHMAVGFPDWITGSRKSFDLSTQEISPNRLRTMPTQSEIQEYTKNSLWRIDSELLRDCLVTAFNEEFEDIGQFRLSLVNCLDL